MGNINPSDRPGAYTYYYYYYYSIRIIYKDISIHDIIFTNTKTYGLSAYIKLEKDYPSVIAKYIIIIFQLQDLKP